MVVIEIDSALLSRALTSIAPFFFFFYQMYTYTWVQGAAPPNATDREGYCVRSTVHRSKAVSPAFDLQEFTSTDYSTWTESRWKTIKGRIFLVASHELEVGTYFTPLIFTLFDALKSNNIQSSITLQCTV